ncbi:PREDICTED: protein SMG5 [Rhagoletis zephyria]|uniref:protein SMG5 n=1 Tax=Rhagoletis zephyria TaxID=28612 RepID=UPI00081183C3|nr:PREDICTED: protein SMG5 [Rhagoletis zephyria]XP_017464507.1 PREDICTED: protein SMG5 [Rhagoletis zephyria]XP_017464508.1 PREDICTED: protein SMG5 [Rhagoletis zephyria]
MEQGFSSGGSNASGDSVGGFGRNNAVGNASEGNGSVGDIIYNKNITHKNSANGNGLTPEVKEIYRSLYIVAKNLDDEKKHITTISQLFQHELEEKRAQLVQLCKKIVFKDYQSVGKKAREIMWRKGYYEFIAYVKKNWHKELKDTTQAGNQDNLIKVERFLCAGISNYKRMAAKMEEIYDLDLKYLIDFSIISDGYMREIEQSSSRDGCGGGDISAAQAVDKSLEAVSFALDTIHSALLSLGDLHRYFLDFRIDTRLKVTKQQAAKYYFEAFKLNPAIGMSQNQLGTLYYGQNHDLDSIYHYLYSLVSIVPFELSENNVCKLFAAHAEYLEKLEPEKIEFSLQDFYARFYLIVDIFFFDKEVPDFNSLCHCVLVDLRKVLCSKAFTLEEGCIFKIVSILFFCLSKLKMINSQKVYSLNAFLVAVCSDLMDACIVNLEQNILAKSTENEEFHGMYADKFEEFNMVVRKSRNEYKNWLVNIGEADRKDKKSAAKPSLKEFYSDSRESQRSNDDYVIKTQDSHKHAKIDGGADKNGDPISTRSSDEAKESDLKTPLSCKSKKKGMKLRRRRRKIAQSDDSSCYDTESDMDTDFSTDDEDYTDLSSNFDTDFSDIEAEPVADERDDADEADFAKHPAKSESQEQNAPRLSSAPSKESLTSNDGVGPTFSDNEDVVIEEEKIIYPNEPSGQLTKQRTDSQEVDSEELLRSFEVLQLNSGSLNFRNTDNEESLPPVAEHNEKHQYVDDGNLNRGEPPKKLVYRNKYTKINPNIIVEFARHEPTMRALKILYDWLRINHEILFGCYHSNPEFIHKIMKLLNYCNIDIFTRKVYFEREFLTTANVRTQLGDLFDVRANVPLAEDFVFKNFDIFQGTQLTLDWETTIREHVTPEEECILRIFKMVDFGFFICKQKKFNYRFCVKTRRFTENAKKKREEKKSSSRRRERRTMKNATRKRAEGRTRRYSDRKNGIVRKSYTSNEEKDTVEECKKVPRKGYLRNRNIEKSVNSGNSGGAGGGGGGGTSASTTTNSAVCDKVLMQSSSGADEERSEAMSKKCEIMGKLWLKNEVETLEEELRKNPLNIIMTPFLVVDAKALTEYNGIVKNLVKTKKFIVLIPNAVLNELDDLKKRSENARNVIRWLEQEFKHGNRHLRAQRDNENLTLSLLKIPRKLDRDAGVFLQIAQFCNHLVANHSDPKSTEFQTNVVTYLSGDSLYEKQRHQTNFSFTGILDAIPVRYEQISNFYAKFKANKK